MGELLHPLRTSEHIRGSYLRYLKTTFPIKDAVLRQQFEKEIARPGRLVKGPLLEATPPFVTEKSILELIDEEVLHPDFRLLDSEDLPVERPLYRHQQRAIERIVREGRNLVIATGTGSGKTEGFLIPIFDWLLRERADRKLCPGVRALLLYPMNALANDQLKRLRSLLKDFPDITFARYTGETRQEREQGVQQFRRQFGTDPLVNELTSRDEMRDAPPHILLTNYAMLEYLLIRPEDCELFGDESNQRFWRFLVLDEAHVYSGASGIEVAMLLRRLKDRVVESRQGALRCIATSATLGGGKQDFPEVAAFAKSLFGESFEYVSDDATRQDVVEAERAPVSDLGPVWGKGNPGLYDALKSPSLVNRTDAEIVETFLRIGCDWGVPDDVCQEIGALCGVVQGPEKIVNVFLYGLLRGDARLRVLRSLLEERSFLLAEASRRVFEDFPDREADQALIDLVDLAVQARPSPDSNSLLPARYHLFARALEGAFVCLEEGELEAREGEPVRGHRLFLERREVCKNGDHEAQVAELAVCRRCGQEFLMGCIKDGTDLSEDVGPGTYFRPSSFDDAPRQQRACFLWDEVEEASLNEDEMVEIGVEEDDSAVVGEPYTICTRCGAVVQGDGSLPCDCGVPGRIFRRVELAGNMLRKCPSCGGQSRFGDVAARFLTGQDAPVSVLATSLYQMLPADRGEVDEWGNVTSEQSRKLLIFSDSRQDAAFFAPYLERTYGQILSRRLILSALEDEGFRLHPPRLQELEEPMIDQVRAANLFTQDQGFHEQRKEVLTWLMQELMPLDLRNSLEGLGLVDFRLVRPQGYQPPPIFKGAPWNLSDDETWDLLCALLNTLRHQAAVAFPENVSPRDEAFQPRNREFFVRESGSVPLAGIYSWLPSGQGRTNRRLDFLVRLLKRRGMSNNAEEEAKKTLHGLWQRVFTVSKGVWMKSDLLVPKTIPSQGIVYQLSHKFWEVVPRWLMGGDGLNPLYRCDSCRMLSRFNVGGACPNYQCKGTLERFNPEEDLVLQENHYRRLYQDLVPLSLKAEEHTAQLTSEAAAETQQRFMDGHVNVLSCSTTFELGVDVGELQAVLMRNVPPQTANYIQRAGRAGRRIDSTGFALTYAQRRSHDLTHYAEPERFVSGKIRPPVVTIANESIVRRHLHSVAFALFFRRHRDLFGDVGTFFEGIAEGENGPILFNSFLGERPKDLLEALKRIVPENLHEELSLDTWDWCLILAGRKGSRLDKVDAEVMGELEELERLAREAYNNQDGTRGNRYKRNRETIRKRYLLGFLGSRNVLPKYGFPVDVVPLEVRHHSQEANRLELDRDLRVALSEYAPGSHVIAGGRVWVSSGLKQVPNRGWPTYWYMVCSECSRYQSALTEDDLGQQCRVCGADLYGGNRAPARFVIPEFGFVTCATEDPKRPGEMRPPRSYASRVFFAEYKRPDEGNEPDEIPLEPEGRWEPEAGLGLSKRYSRQGKLAVVNSGLHGRGFRICDTCGFAESPGLNPGRRINKGHTSPWGRRCSGQIQTLHLGHEFLTDVLEIRFTGAVPSNASRGFWLSLTYALLEGASKALDIRREDIDGCLYPVGGEETAPAVILFDDVPGGAGHVRRIGNQLHAVLQAALDRVRDCECTEDTSCYECLRNYRNQWFHDELTRGPVRTFLERLLPAIYTDENRGAYVLGVADRGRWLARQVQHAKEAIFFVPFLGLQEQDTVANSGQDWIEVFRIARGNGAKIKLALTQWPHPRESRRAEDAALLHELFTLQQRGVELFRWNVIPDLPQWPIYIHEGEEGGFRRLVRWQDPAKGREEGLSIWTGRSAFEIVTDEARVEEGRATLEGLLTRACEPMQEEDAFLKQESRLIRVKEGPTSGLAEYIGEWFSPGIVQVDIRDPYLSNDNQLDNLKELTKLISTRCQPSDSSPIRVSVLTRAPNRDEREQRYQREKLNEIRGEFSREHMDFQFKTLPYGHPQYQFHDREIRLRERDGKVTAILIGRGLDFIQRRKSGRQISSFATPTYIAIFREQNN